ncbi:hypothetical protein I302_104686 [Kwoniella bestiolae CBS 10118]|uniref:Uncharacterized protein n=1 Tax=Kwoniella bestiolae CBS 10118 TaxID=1296100 RepID=A0A1B9FS27_9TREE|nr:hypothetical protein I302_09245 [Kwoniella bestiolae CBS 10118]OCF21566.1 hypothetical protein I302_09245 [Kwoniella bestiolae CBS 10118]
MDINEHPMLQLHPILVQLATIPAIAIASYKALNVWRAVSALPLNPHSAPSSATTPTPSVISEGLKRWRSLTATKKAKQIAAFISLFTVIMGIHVFLVYVLPRISSQSVLDVVWSIMMLAMFTGTIRYTSDIAFPTPRSVRYHQPKPDSSIRLAIEFEGDKKAAWKKEIVRQLLSLSVTAGILYSTWAGYTTFHPILAASYVISSISTMRFPMMSIRRIVQFVSAYLAVVPVITLVVGVVVNMFAGDSQDESQKNDDDKENMTFASDWVLSLMLIFGEIFGIMVPAVLTAMTLRFEYSLAHEPVSRSIDPSSEAAPVQIPNEYPSFPRPIFLSSLFSLFTSIVIIESISYFVPAFEWLSITPVTVFITVPVVFGGTALAAVWFGKFNQWWRYNEVWIPPKKITNISEEGTKDVDEAQVPLLGGQGAVEEKETV